jgi:hypothetical protein
MKKGCIKKSRNDALFHKGDKEIGYEILRTLRLIIYLEKLQRQPHEGYPRGGTRNDEKINRLQCRDRRFPGFHRSGGYGVGSGHSQEAEYPDDHA